MKLKTAWILWIAATGVVIVAIIMNIVKVTQSAHYFSELNDKIQASVNSANHGQDAWFNKTKGGTFGKWGWAIGAVISLALVALGHYSILKYAKTSEGRIKIVFIFLIILASLYFVFLGLLPLIAEKSFLSGSKDNITISSDDKIWVALDKDDANYQAALDIIHGFRKGMSTSLVDTLKVLSAVASGAKTALTVATYVIIRKVAQK